jgi:hypothetical protein
VTESLFIAQKKRAESVTSVEEMLHGQGCFNCLGYPKVAHSGYGDVYLLVVSLA